MNKIGTRIANLRNENAMTQAQLADVLSVSVQAVSKWETSVSNPDISLLCKIADTFNVTIDYLLRGTSRKIQKYYVDCNHSKFDKWVENYLNDGWVIKEYKICPDGEGMVYSAILFEKDVYDE